MAWSRKTVISHELHSSKGPGYEQFALPRLLLIVVGAHLKAETHDRAIGYRLRERVIERLSARFGPEKHARPHPLTPGVCSDLWYLNNETLRTRPTVSIGGPDVNALTAYLADKLPSVLAVEDVYLVQLDPEYADVVACCWGAEHSDTLASVDAFTERYLDEFLDAALKVGTA